MTAAKVMDVIAGPPDCDGQEADATSAHSQVETVVLLERNLYGHPLAGLLWERPFEEVLLELGWEKVLAWDLFVHRKKGLLAYQNDRKEADYGSHVEETDEECGS